MNRITGMAAAGTPSKPAFTPAAGLNAVPGAYAGLQPGGLGAAGGEHYGESPPRKSRTWLVALVVSGFAVGSLVLAVVVTGLLAAAEQKDQTPLSADSWVPYISNEGKFNARFPQVPAEDVKLLNIRRPEKMHRAFSTSGRTTFEVAYFDLDSSYMARGGYDLARFIPAAAESVNGRVVSTQDLVFLGRKATRGMIERGQEYRAEILVLRVDHRLFFVGVEGPPSELGRSFELFLESFELTGDYKYGSLDCRAQWDALHKVGTKWEFRRYQRAGSKLFFQDRVRYEVLSNFEHTAKVKQSMWDERGQQNIGFDHVAEVPRPTLEKLPFSLGDHLRKIATGEEPVGIWDTYWEEVESNVIPGHKTKSWYTPEYGQWLLIKYEQKDFIGELISFEAGK